MKYKNLLALTLSTSFLVACGGGGDSAVPDAAPVTALTFPLQSGFKAFVASGYSKNFTVSGTCSGSGNRSASPATTATVFEGMPALSATSTFTALLGSPCEALSIAQTSTVYFNSANLPLGSESVGVSYAVYSTPVAIPASVSVGSTGTVGTQTLYTNRSKATGDGTAIQSYVVEADSSSTAIVNLILKLYNASGTLTATEQNRYRIDTSGKLTPTSIDIQYSNGSTTRLVLTF